MMGRGRPLCTAVTPITEACPGLLSARRVQPRDTKRPLTQASRGFPALYTSGLGVAPHT